MENNIYVSSKLKCDISNVSETSSEINISLISSLSPFKLIAMYGKRHQPNEWISPKVCFNLLCLMFVMQYNCFGILRKMKKRRRRKGDRSAPSWKRIETTGAAIPLPAGAGSSHARAQANEKNVRKLL